MSDLLAATQEDGQRFPFTERTDSQGRSHIMSYLPLILTILDTEARVNVLPNEIGIQLGAVWKNKTVSIPLSGNLARSEARGLVLSGTVANFSPVLLAFAWSQGTDIPVILEHTNFFAEFNLWLLSVRVSF